MKVKTICVSFLHDIIVLTAYVEWIDKDSSDIVGSSMGKIIGTYQTEATDVFVRVEDFNSSEAAQLVLDTLYPEATAKQVAAFTLRDDTYKKGEAKRARYAEEPFGIPHWTDWDDKYNEIFDNVCSDTMKQFGYY